MKKKQKNTKRKFRRQWMLGFLGFLGFLGISEFLTQDWMRAIWFLWFLWFIYFIPVKLNKGR